MLHKKLNNYYFTTPLLNNFVKILPSYVKSGVCCFSQSTTSMGKLDNKVAIITASTEGIGYAIAQRFAEEGAKVVISSRKQTNVQNALKRLKDLGFNNVIGTVCHVGKAEDRQNLYTEVLTKFGGIDIVVSNAAVNPVMGGVLQCPENSWDKIFEINVKSAFLLSKEVAPLIKKRGGGSIIYVSSIAGLLPFEILGAYSVSKTALLGLTKAVAQELAADNIRVNCIAPGIIKTKFSSAMFESEELLENFTNSIYQKRVGVPEDVSGTAVFLCSDDSRYITGETVVVSGGYYPRI